MISRIVFRKGKKHLGNEESLAVSPLTVFIGPSNSGKSLTLNEMFRLCFRSEPGETLAVKDIEFLDNSETSANNLVSLVQVPGKGSPGSSQDIFIKQHGIVVGQVLSSTLKEIKTPNSCKAFYIDCFTTHLTSYISAHLRVDLIRPKEIESLTQEPTNALQVLFRDNQKRLKVRSKCFDAFGKYFVLDITEIGLLRPCFADEEPSSELQERSLTQEAIDYFSRSTPITKYSDGVMAYTGLMIELTAGNHKILLIDEPEAFLHPSLAKKLGKEIGSLVRTESKQAFI